MKSFEALPGGKLPRTRAYVVLFWRTVYAISMTVQPFLRLPGTSGTKGLNGRFFLCGMYFLLMYWAVVLRQFHCDPPYIFAALSILFLLFQKLLAWIARWRKKQIQKGYIGKSVVYLFCPHIRVSRAIIFGELILCCIAGGLVWLFHNPQLAAWLVTAGLCNSIGFAAIDPLDLRPSELLGDRNLVVKRSGLVVRQVKSQVVATAAR